MGTRLRCCRLSAVADLVIDPGADIRLIDTPFSVAEALAAFDAAYSLAGAIASFTGKVRQDGGVEALELIPYHPLTRTSMLDLAVDAHDRFEIDGLLAWHRTGMMTPGEPIVLVAAAARHRRDAFAAVDFAMDYLKTKAWFWKRERRADGWHWIEPRAQDHADSARWIRETQPT